MRRVTSNEWSPRGVADLEPAAEGVVRSQNNCLVVAGPGAGKTELLAQRASYLLETGLCRPPHRILAISFKRDAARNLRERVARRCGPELARRFESYTFDAWAKGLLDRFRLAVPESHRPTRNYLIDFTFTREDRLRQRLLEVCEQAGISLGQIQELKAVEFYQHFIAESPLDLSTAPTKGTARALAAALWQQSLHTSRSVLTFPMIGLLAELLLRVNPYLLTALRTTYHFVFLDEFQDTTINQYSLLRTAFASSSAVLTAVGDNKQRIMLWAGAYPDVFNAFSSDFAAQRHGLVMNYRSAPRLISIQHYLIAALDPSSPKPVAAPWSNPADGECRVLGFSNDTEEAQYLASLIAVWVRNDKVPPDEICVLVRQTTDRMTEKLRTELSAKGIQCRVQDVLQDLLAEPLTSLVLSTFYVCVQSSSPVNWKSLVDLALDLRGCQDGDDKSRHAINELTSFIEVLRPRLEASTTPEQISTRIKEVLAFIGEGAFRLRFEQYVQDEFFHKTITDLSERIASERLRTPTWTDALDGVVGVNSIPFMTIHKSKGLEYHTVIVLGLEDYPFRNISTNNGEEECNVFVAFSRAKQRVIITSTAMRNSREQARNDVDKVFKVLESAGVLLEPIHMLGEQ